MSLLGCVGSGNKLQEQKKSPWSLEERRAETMSQGEEEVEEGGSGVLPRGEHVLFQLFSYSKPYSKHSCMSSLISATLC